MKIKRKTLEKYDRYLSLCLAGEPRPLEKIPMDENGVTAIEAFHWWESSGRSVGTREPELLEKYHQGKRWHGVTVALVAESFAVDRLITSREIKDQYPAWVADEIFSAAAKIALNTPSIGYVPTFIRERRDCSEAVVLPNGEPGFEQ